MRLTRPAAALCLSLAATGCATQRAGTSAAPAPPDSASGNAIVVDKDQTVTLDPAEDPTQSLFDALKSLPASPAPVGPSPAPSAKRYFEDAVGSCRGFPGEQGHSTHVGRLSGR